MSEELKNAYRITINDLRIAINNCGLFEFKKRKEYAKLIEKYKNMIYK